MKKIGGNHTIMKTFYFSVSLCLIFSFTIVLNPDSGKASPLKQVNHLPWMIEKGIINSNYINKSNDYLDKSPKLDDAVETLYRLTHPDYRLNQQKKALNISRQQILAWGLANHYISIDEMAFPHQFLSTTRIERLFNDAGYPLQLMDKQKTTRKELFQKLGDLITNQVTIAHTNDLHGHLDENQAAGEFGFAKIATIIQRWRKESDNFLLIDGGDSFQGTIYVNELGGESIIPILNYLNYDAMVAGNHEFDFGTNQLLKLSKKINYPIISANIYKLDGTRLLPPVHIEKIAGKEFALIGIASPQTKFTTHPKNVKDLRFASPIKVAKNIVNNIRDEVDHIILISHAGNDIDTQIAKEVTSIDLIIGGHTHTPIVEPKQVNHTLIVQDWEYGKSIGRIDLYYYHNKLVTFSGGLKEYNESIKADPHVKRMVANITKTIDDELSKVLTVSKVQLNGGRKNVRYHETNIGNLITDILRDVAQKKVGKHVDAAIINAGDIRTRLAPGNITRKDLYSLLPFSNQLVILKLTGSQLKKAMEHGLSNVKSGSGAFPQISGIRLKYDSSREPGNRITSIEVNEKPIINDHIYHIATTDFLATGGDGYTVFKNKQPYDTGLSIFSIVEKALIQKNNIHPVKEGRIIDISHK